MEQHTGRALVVSICILFVTGDCSGQTTAPSRIRQSVKKSIELVQKSATEYLNHRDCFSCHHQALPVLALSIARQNGFDVDQKVVKEQIQRTKTHFEKYKQQYLDGKGTGGQVDTAGYGLWALSEGKVEGSESTAAVIDYLLGRDKKRVYWRRSSERPPSEASNFMSTFVAVKAIQNYGSEKQEKEIGDRLKGVFEWVSSSQAKDTEDLVFQINLATTLNSEPEFLKSLCNQLIKAQKDDGGWSQKKELSSDAYATATAIYALRTAKAIQTSDQSYLNAVNYLLKNQRSDGSWYVKSRSDPFQEYFESGFPHGKDQFISITATCWALIVLSETGSLK